MKHLALLPLLFATSAVAEPPHLPPAEKVVEALDGHPDIMAADARVAAARAQAVMLRKGHHELMLSGSYMRRTVDREGDFNEYDATLTRGIRLPRKAALDRKAGALGVEVADNRKADARHQIALTLATQWHDWLEAAALARNDAMMIAAHDAEISAIERRLALKDATLIERDQAQSARALAASQLAESLALTAQARAMLAASFPEIPLPADAPMLADPEVPPETLELLHDRVIEHSHEIEAAAREVARLGTVASRARLDRIADPSLGVRVFSERNGMERGAGLVASIPLGGGYRRAAADQADADTVTAEHVLIGVRRIVQATADADVSNVRTRMEAWRSARASAESITAASRRTERGYQLGALDLSALLLARRQQAEARRAEIRACTEAQRAILKLRIDAHVVWATSETSHH